MLKRSTIRACADWIRLTMDWATALPLTCFSASRKPLEFFDVIATCLGILEPHLASDIRKDDCLAVGQQAGQLKPCGPSAVPDRANQALPGSIDRKSLTLAACMIR
jgi:hypothetical protein